MPTHKTRYEGQFFSENGRWNRLRIYDKNYTSSTVIPIKIGGGGLKIKMVPAPSRGTAHMKNRNIVIHIIITNITRIYRHPN